MTDRSFGILVELKDRFSKPLKGLVAPIENAKRELKSLEQAGRDLKWAEKYQESLDKLQPSLQAAREKQQQLADQIAATENPSKRLLSQYEKAQLKLTELEAKEREYQGALNASREALHKAGVDTEDLAAAREQLAERTDHARAKVLGFNTAIKSLDVRETAQKFQGLATKLILVKTALAALSAAAVGLAPVLAKLGAAYGMAFGTGLSTAKVAAMSKELQALADSTHVSTQALQEWRIAGRFQGIEAELGEFGDMANVFQDIAEKTKSLGTKEGDDFAQSLKSIGLAAKDLKNLKPDEALLKIGDALSKSKLTDQQKNEFLSGISEDAAKLLPLLQKNSSKLAEIKDYANKVGAIQSPEQLEAMKQTNNELSFFKLGLEGVMVRLSAVGSNVINTLGPNIRQLFVDAKAPIEEWSKHVDSALKKFKSDLDATGSWGEAFKRSFQSFYPTLYSFLSGAAQFGRGYGDAFIKPMLDSLKKGYARIGEAMGGGDGIEAKGRAWGEVMRPMTAIVDEVANAIAFLIENVRYLKSVSEFTPLGALINALPAIRSALDFVGEGIKKLGQALGLIDPESKASGFTVLLGSLLALAGASLMNKLALGALGATFSFVKFALAPLAPVLSITKFAFETLINPLSVKTKLLLKLGPLITKLQGAWTGVIGAWGKVGGFITAFGGKLSAGFGRLVQLAQGLGPRLAAGFAKAGQLLALLGSKIGAGFRLIGQAALWLGRTALPVVGRAFMLVGRALLMNPIGLTVTAIAAAGYLIYRNWSTIGPFFANLWGRVKASFNNARQALANMSWGEIAGTIVKGFISLPSKLFEVGVKAIGELAIGILSKLGVIDSNTAKILSSMVNSFAELPGKMLDIGIQAMSGLADGIISAGKRALDAAKNIAADIGNSIKGFFDIRSPSRLMMQYGGHISTGLSVGISAEGKQALKATRQLSEGVRKQMQTGVVASLAEARQRRQQAATHSALPKRETLISALQQSRASNPGVKQEVGGEIRVRIEAPGHMNTSAKVSRPVGSKVGLSANVGRVSW